MISTPKIDHQIEVIDKVICRHLDNLNSETRGMISQDILSHLRNFTEHIMLKFYAISVGTDLDNTWENLQLGVSYVEGRGNLRTLRRFHDYLQMVASHYTLDEENSERLMLKYYEYLLKTKILLRKEFNMEVLFNLSKFPLNTDETLQEYYDRIADKVENHVFPVTSRADRYYIQKIKPFFANEKIYYEITFTPANDYASKFDRIIAFTDYEIIDNYAVRLTLENDNIQILGKTMPILIITDWEVSIRNCEYENFSKIIYGKKIAVTNGEQIGLAEYLKKTGFTLVDLVTFSDARYKNATSQISQRAQVTRFLSVLEQCRRIIIDDKAGARMLRYLLQHMNNKVIKNQIALSQNERLSGLYLENGCIPFDDMPFINSPKGHNPRLGDLFSCIPSANRKYELLARLVRNNTEVKGQLFTAISEITSFDNISECVKAYNKTIWFGHRESSKLVIENGQIFINGYKNDTCDIVRKIQTLTTEGIQNYSSAMNAWLDNPNNGVDCEEKKEALRHMFTNSKVALIYGSAGTGKSTLINHISQYFADKDKLFLSQTNPAVDNLKRKVTVSNSEFMTIAKFTKRSHVKIEYDILIIDECSTVSNRDMKDVLSKASYKLLVLVGDTYQISSIRFGNWFSIAKAFVPSTSVTELTKPYRSSNEGLLTLWDRVRNIGIESHNGDAVLEVSIRQNYSTTLDASIFDQATDNEIILCLNYDGLYGINNINRFLQESNPSKAVEWGVQIFKENDPILFNDSGRFGPAIYNNTKGKIVGIEIVDKGSPSEKIQFDIELDKAMDESSTWGYDFELLGRTENGNSIIRFTVNKLKSTDEDENNPSDVIPFQVAYAVSIHKSQGLEYRSVKIVITDEVDELITHNIFYTAITRAQEKLKIYWTPEVENKLLSKIQPINNNKDIGLLKRYLV